MPSGLASSDTRRRWLLLGGWMSAWAALAWWRWSREPYFLDDAFISFRYARNLVEGHGLVYNPGERVEGYTNFLWTLFAAGFLRLGIDPLTGTRLLGVGSYLLSTAAVAGLLLRDSPSRPLWRRACLALAPLALILPAGYAGFAGTGMETSFVGLLGLAVGWRGFLAPPRTRGDRAIFAALTMALVATRLDGAPWVAVAAGVMLWQPFARGPEATRPRARGAATLRLFAPAAALLGALLIGRVWYYGELLPNTFYAKVEGIQGLAIGWRYLLAYLAGSPQVFVCLGLMAAGLKLSESGEVRQFILFAALCAGVHALYVVTVGGDFMHYRLMFHVYPLLVAAAVAGLVAVDRKHSLIGLAASSALAIASLAPSVLDSRYHMESLEEMHRCCAVPGVAIGRRLHEVLPSDAVIATTMAGGIAYYSGLVTIDQLGLTDREVARNGVPAQPVRRGHTKRASTSYLVSRGVNLVLHHPKVFSCHRPRTKGPGAYVFIRMEGDACLRTIYLTPTAELTHLFCSQPDLFVVRGIDCPPATPARVPAPGVARAGRLPALGGAGPSGSGRRARSPARAVSGERNRARQRHRRRQARHGSQHQLHRRRHDLRLGRDRRRLAERVAGGALDVPGRPARERGDPGDRADGRGGHRVPHREARRLARRQLQAGGDRQRRDRRNARVPGPLVPWLDGMLARRQVRMLVDPSRTFYLVDKGEQRGLFYDRDRAYEDDLNKKRGKKQLHVDEVVVTGPASPEIHDLEDLGGREVFVRLSSRYFQSLWHPNGRLGQAGKPPSTTSIG